MIRVNIGRMENLLKLPNNLSATSRDDICGQGVVRVEAANFSWNRDLGNTLVGITLAAEPGQLITVCGRVGSGKTTLAAGLLQLAEHTDGVVQVGGTMSYVPQSPQILNDTVKNNILFG